MNSGAKEHESVNSKRASVYRWTPDKVPELWSPEFFRIVGPMTYERGLAYAAHMCVD